MSRHRIVRNINIQDELDDDALSEEGEDMTDEQHAQMESGFEHLRAVLGDEAISGLDDAIIKDTLWQFYFDVEKSISSLYEEQDRRAAAKERKVTSPRSKSRWWSRFRRKGDDEQEVCRDNDGVPISPEGQLGDFGYPHYPIGPVGYYSEDMERPRVPLIVLAQQGQHQPDYYPAPQYLEYGQGMDSDDIPLDLMSPADRNSRLSTITELTERTEPSRHWPSKQQLVAMNNPRALSSSETTSSYGQIIDRRSDASLSDGYPYPPVDPNEIPPSPSPSAVKRLSIYDSAPSVRTPTESEIQSEKPMSPRPPSVSVPPTENMPDIPDFMSKSSEKPPAPPEKDVPPRARLPKPSKLAELASSRASTISSSRSSDLESTSVLTYLALRPSAQSRLSLASRATSAKPPLSEISEKSSSSVKTARTASVKPAPTPLEKSLQSIKPPSTTTSSMSSHVRKAIQTAMELEVHDQGMTTEQHAESVSETSSVSTVKLAKPLSPTSSIRSVATTALPAVRNELDSKARPQSKLAKLAQAKANVHAVIPRTTKSIAPSSPPKELPKPHTEYFTPIANGATATTAITTSYHSLHSLSTAQLLEPVPLVQMPGVQSRPSKLALRVKKAQDKSFSHSSATDDDALPSPPPLFLPKSIRSHKEKHNKTPRYGREELNLVEMYQAEFSKSKSALGLELPQQHGQSCAKPPTPDLSVRSASFAFDVPSPDDIVFNARRGTALTQRR
ncbi:hypothetical protein BS17DRAFT_752266 [Gyrodon lividus]|nr:hypothetical protein BS17DRAFT_752266 [Gyrodon lividus]